MSDQTKIEWADHTFNPWEGCTKVSPGCAHCYAETRNHRFGGDNWGKSKPRRRTKDWKKPLRWNNAINWQHEIGNIPTRPRIFPSLCDWLDEEIPAEWLADFLKLIQQTPNLDWLLLTKRPENFDRRMFEASKLLPFEPVGTNEVGTVMANFACGWRGGDHPPENVWIGVSVEDQKRADERIPELLKIPAKVRFLSVEPLLWPVRLTTVCGLSFNRNPDHTLARKDGTGIDWVIVGGESGPKARPCNVDWIRDIVRQCEAAGVPCFVKQLGANIRDDRCVSPYPIPDVECWPSGAVGHESDMSIHLQHGKGGDPSEWPEDLRVREFPL